MEDNSYVHSLVAQRRSRVIFFAVLTLGLLALSFLAARYSADSFPPDKSAGAGLASLSKLGVLLAAGSLWLLLIWSRKLKAAQRGLRAESKVKAFLAPLEALGWECCYGWTSPLYRQGDIDVVIRSPENLLFTCEVKASSYTAARPDMEERALSQARAVALSEKGKDGVCPEVIPLLCWTERPRGWAGWCQMIRWGCVSKTPKGVYLLPAPRLVAWLRAFNRSSSSRELDR